MNKKKNVRRHQHFPSVLGLDISRDPLRLREYFATSAVDREEQRRGHNDDHSSGDRGRGPGPCADGEAADAGADRAGQDDGDGHKDDVHRDLGQKGHQQSGR